MVRYRDPQTKSKRRHGHPRRFPSCPRLEFHCHNRSQSTTKLVLLNVGRSHNKPLPSPSQALWRFCKPTRSPPPLRLGLRVWIPPTRTLVWIPFCRIFSPTEPVFTAITARTLLRKCYAGSVTKALRRAAIYPTGHWNAFPTQPFLYAVPNQKSHPVFFFLVLKI